MDKRKPDLFDWAAAKAARDEGMESAVEAEDEQWLADAIGFAASIPQGWEGLFEEVRGYLLARGLPRPHTYHVWGGVCGAMIKLGMFERIDHWSQPKAVKSHASAYRMLRRT